ncbi:MAG: tRNA ((7)-)-methyltransferase [Pseudomonadota bacterium]
MLSLLKQTLKNAALAVAPGAAVQLLAARARTHRHRYFERAGIRDRNRALQAELGMTVLGGPFRGMRLPEEVAREQLGPYVLGSYESELHPVLESALAVGVTQVVDVGCCVGFYAVGLALRLPNIPVHAFDTDPWARTATRRAAELNGLRTVEVHGACTAQWLESNLCPGALVVSDCEGFEGDLLCAVPSGRLQRVTLLVEVHDDVVPGVEARLACHLEGTHLLERVQFGGSPRDAFLPPHVPSAVPVQELLLEHRAEQRWLVARPR